MNIYCPFVKEKCKGNECAMWKDERCLIISFMEHFTTQYDMELEEGLQTGSGFTESGLVESGLGEREVPNEIRLATPEELAAELISFAKEQLPNMERIPIRRIIGMVSHLFWENKSVLRWGMPAEIQFKIDKAEMMAQEELGREREASAKAQLEKERDGLPSLVNSCIDWAKEHGLKRVTKAHIEAFLMDKNIEILPQTRNSLHALVSVQLRSKY